MNNIGEGGGGRLEDFFFFFTLFMYFVEERGRGRGAESKADSVLSSELHTQFDLTTLRSQP